MLKFTRICISYYKKNRLYNLLEKKKLHKYFHIEKQHAPWVRIKSEYSDVIRSKCKRHF